MNSMNDWNIQSRAHACEACGKPFVDQQPYHTLLYDEKQDFRRLYVTSTGKGPGDAGAGGKGDVHVFDVGTDNRVSNRRLFTSCMVDDVKCAPDGVRCDVEGNVWIASNAGRALGYSGVTVWNPAGKLIGRIRLPEVCGNITFGGPKRNRLFMAASQSIYALYVATQGAAPG